MVFTNNYLLSAKPVFTTYNFFLNLPAIIPPMQQGLALARAAG